MKKKYISIAIIAAVAGIIGYIGYINYTDPMNAVIPVNYEANDGWWFRSKDFQKLSDKDKDDLFHFFLVAQVNYNGRISKGITVRKAIAIGRGDRL